MSPATEEALVVHRGSFTTRILLTGELIAEQADPIIAPNEGIWPLQIRWLAEDGAELAAGDTVVDFDNSQLAGSLEVLEQEVLESGLGLRSQRAEVRTEELQALFKVSRAEAEAEKRKIDAEVPQGLVSAKEFEELRLAWRRAELDVAEARTALALTREATQAQVALRGVELQQARMKLETARKGIERLKLRAPKPGIVLLEDHFQEGRPYQSSDTIWPGLTVATLPELSSMIVEARLLDVDDQRIAVGMPVTAVIDSFPQLSWPGRVEAIDRLATEVGPESTRRAFRARIRLDTLDVERMRPGMSVRVTVEARLDDVLWVPRQAVTWEQEAGELRAQVRVANGSLVAVGLGPCAADACVLTAGPLREDERLRNATEREETR